MLPPEPVSSPATFSGDDAAERRARIAREAALAAQRAAVQRAQEERARALARAAAQRARAEAKAKAEAAAAPPPSIEVARGVRYTPATQKVTVTKWSDPPPAPKPQVMPLRTGTVEVARGVTLDRATGGVTVKRWQDPPPAPKAPAGTGSIEVARGVTLDRATGEVSVKPWKDPAPPPVPGGAAKEAAQKTTASTRTTLEKATTDWLRNPSKANKANVDKALAAYGTAVDEQVRLAVLQAIAAGQDPDKAVAAALKDARGDGKPASDTWLGRRAAGVVGDKLDPMVEQWIRDNLDGDPLRSTSATESALRLERSDMILKDSVKVANDKAAAAAKLEADLRAYGSPYVSQAMRDDALAASRDAAVTAGRFSELDSRIAKIEFDRAQGDYLTTPAGAGPSVVGALKRAADAKRTQLTASLDAHAVDQARIDALDAERQRVIALRTWSAQTFAPYDESKIVDYHRKVLSNGYDPTATVLPPSDFAQKVVDGNSPNEGEAGTKGVGNGLYQLADGTRVQRDANGRWKVLNLGADEFARMPLAREMNPYTAALWEAEYQSANAQARLQDDEALFSRTAAVLPGFEAPVTSSSDLAGQLPQQRAEVEAAQRRLASDAADAPGARFMAETDARQASARLELTESGLAWQRAAADYEAARTGTGVPADVLAAKEEALNDAWQRLQTAGAKLHLETSLGEVAQLQDGLSDLPTAVPRDVRDALASRLAEAKAGVGTASDDYARAVALQRATDKLTGVQMRDTAAVEAAAMPSPDELEAAVQERLDTVGAMERDAFARRHGGVTQITASSRDEARRELTALLGPDATDKQIDEVVDAAFDPRGGRRTAPGGVVTIDAVPVGVMAPDGQGAPGTRLTFSVTRNELAMPMGGRGAYVPPSATPGGTPAQFTVDDGGKTFDDVADYQKWFATPDVSRWDAGLEAVGGLLQTGIGALTTAGGVATGWTGAGVAVAAGGALVTADGAARGAHGIEQLFTGKASDPYIAQGLQAAGVSRDVANRVDAGVGLATMLGGGWSGTAKLLAGAGRARQTVAAVGGLSLLDGTASTGVYVATGQQVQPLQVQVLTALGMDDTAARYVQVGTSLLPALAGAGLGARGAKAPGIPTELSVKPAPGPTSAWPRRVAPGEVPGVPASAVRGAVDLSTLPRAEPLSLRLAPKHATTDVLQPTVSDRAFAREVDRLKRRPRTGAEQRARALVEDALWIKAANGDGRSVRQSLLQRPGTVDGERFTRFNAMTEPQKQAAVRRADRVLETLVGADWETRVQLGRERGAPPNVPRYADVHLHTAGRTNGYADNRNGPPLQDVFTQAARNGVDLRHAFVFPVPDLTPTLPYYLQRTAGGGVLGVRTHVLANGDLVTAERVHWAEPGMRTIDMPAGTRLGRLGEEGPEVFGTRGIGLGEAYVVPPLKMGWRGPERSLWTMEEVAALPPELRERVAIGLIGGHSADPMGAQALLRELHTANQLDGVHGIRLPVAGGGELTVIKEAVTINNAWGGVHNLEAFGRQLKLYEKAGGMVVVHADAGMPAYSNDLLLAKQTGIENLDPLYRVFAEHPGATIVHAHFGGLGRSGRPSVEHADAIDRLLATHPNVYIDASWDVAGKYFYDNPDARLTRRYIDLINKYPDRFLAGSDEVAQRDNFKGAIADQHRSGFISKLQHPDLFLHGNYERLVNRSIDRMTDFRTRNAEALKPEKVDALKNATELEAYIDGLEPPGGRPAGPDGPTGSRPSGPSGPRDGAPPAARPDDAGGAKVSVVGSAAATLTTAALVNLISARTGLPIFNPLVSNPIAFGVRGAQIFAKSLAGVRIQRLVGALGSDPARNARVLDVLERRLVDRGALRGITVEKRAELKAAIDTLRQTPDDAAALQTLNAAPGWLLSPRTVAGTLDGLVRHGTLGFNIGNAATWFEHHPHWDLGNPDAWAQTATVGGFAGANVLLATNNFSLLKAGWRNVADVAKQKSYQLNQAIGMGTFPFAAAAWAAHDFEPTPLGLTKTALDSAFLAGAGMQAANDVRALRGKGPLRYGPVPPLLLLGGALVARELLEGPNVMAALSSPGGSPAGSPTPTAPPISSPSPTASPTATATPTPTTTTASP